MRLIGMAERALDLMCQRVLERSAFGSALADKGTIRADIAASRADIEQCRCVRDVWCNSASRDTACGSGLVVGLCCREIMGNRDAWCNSASRDTACRMCFWKRLKRVSQATYAWWILLSRGEAGE